MEVESDIIEEAIGAKGYHKHVPEYGERAWLIEGEEFDVVYWDMGNGWCEIMDVIPRGNKKSVEEFYEKLRKIISENYDEKGYRISDS